MPSWPYTSLTEAHPETSLLRIQDHGGEHRDEGGLSRLGSRLPSLEPEPRDRQSANGPGPPWKISGSAYRHIRAKMDDFVPVLAPEFVLPSRHVLARFLEGCMTGYLQHLPFIHIPTFSVMESAPELLLGMAAIGSQYKFEAHKGESLFYAAKAIAMEQLQRRATARPEDAGSLPKGTEGSLPADLQTIQALLCMMAMATWSSRSLLREALSLQSILAVQARDSGLAASLTHIEARGLTWQQWVLRESCKRTYLILYCFYNLHSIAYNISPLILTAEVHITLPSLASAWTAEDADKWKTAYGSCDTEVSFQAGKQP